ncbi:uncharacterized protein DS421_1g32700 [Arachis hypogaea]|nr:uncharacterized protein DS421_1g32700 [Arachis hypogaea]
MRGSKRLNSGGKLVIESGPSREAQRRVTGARRGIANGSIMRAGDVLRGVQNEERLGFFDMIFFIAIRGFFVRHNEEWVGVRHNEDKVRVRSNRLFVRGGLRVL